MKETLFGNLKAMAT